MNVRGVSRRAVAVELATIAAGLVTTVVILVVVAKMWHLHPRVPLNDRGDANLTMGGIKNFIQHGWISKTDKLGYPFGQDLRDFPAVGDTLNLVGVWILTRFSHDPALVLNLFFLATYPLVWLGGYTGARMLRLGRMVAFAVAVLFTFLPYHYLHGPPHLFLSNYAMVPLAVAVIIRQLGDEPFFEAPSGWEHPVRAVIEILRSRRARVGIAIIAVSAATGLYYAVFFIVLMPLVSLFAAGARRSLDRLWAGICSAAVAIFVLGLQLISPTLYAKSHGANSSVTNRSVADVEFFSLKINDMVLPVANHVLAPFDRARVRSQAVFLRGEATGALGVLGVLGLGGALYLLIVGALRGGRPGRAARCGLVALIALGMCTVGGGGQLLGSLGFTQIRAWSRMSVVIAFAGFVALGYGLETIITRFTRTRFGHRRWMVIGGLAALVVVGVVDTNPPGIFSGYAARDLQWNIDRQFVAGIETTLTPDAKIFQLPLVRYPESPAVGGMVDYDHVRGYIHSNTLFWSYGGVKGREADWQARLFGKDPVEVARSVAVAGFDGLWFDRLGYLGDADRYQAELTAALGAPLVSGDGRTLLYDLRPLRTSVVAELGENTAATQKAALLDPVVAHIGDGFYAPELDPTLGVFSWSGPRGEIIVRTPSDKRQTVEVTFTLGAAVAGDRQVRITGAGIDKTVAVPPEGAKVQLRIDAHAFETVLTLTSDAPRFAADPRDLRFRVIGLDAGSLASS